jgi:hypothetical protein
MPPPSSAQKLRQKLQLTRYLKELGALIGRPVQADELGSLEQAAAMRLEARASDTQSRLASEIAFSERRSERFKRFLQRLRDANPSSVHVWTPRTIDCGTLVVPSLDVIKFDFDFAVNDEGILAFATSDGRDGLLLDFSRTPTGEEVMKIETQGANWTEVIY